MNIEPDRNTKDGSNGKGLPDWRRVLAPWLSLSVSDVELATRIKDRCDRLERENQRLAVLCGEIAATKGLFNEDRT